jgi:putative membrane protein
MKRMFLPVAALVALAAYAPGAPRPATPSSPALDDATIVAIFDAANTADIETGDLAAKMGHDQRVRAMGAQFSHDHATVRQMGRDLAKKLGVTPTPPAGDQSAVDQAKVMQLLRSKKGAAFDQAYLQHEVAFHAAVIDAINKTLLPAIQNPELKSLVEKVAPAFQGHLLAAENLEKTLGH